MTDAQEPISRRFETSIEIAAPRAAVWDAIATGEGLQRWFAPEAKAEAEVGGEVVWRWSDHHNWVQRVQLVEPETRLQTRYDSSVDDGAGGKKPLFIDFHLAGEGGMTTLRLVQSGFGPEAGFDDEYDGISHGWPVELRSLRLYLENHRGKDRKLAWSTMDLDLDATEAWRRLTGDQGFACGTIVESMREGEPFRFVTTDGDVLAGDALHCHRRQFSGDILSHGGGFFRISCQTWAGMTHVWLWLGAYDQSAEDLAALQGRWDTMLERLFVTNDAAAAQGGG